MKELVVLQVRPSLPEDESYLREWFLEGGGEVLPWFPMGDEREVEDSIRVWMHYVQMGAGLTVECNGAVCGMAILNISPYVKLAHTCLLSVIVGKAFRGKGAGSVLLRALMRLAKETFHIEILHLEVYQTNPAEQLYKRLGFREFGKQPHFTKENGKYLYKKFMQRVL